MTEAVTRPPLRRYQLPPYYAILQAAEARGSDVIVIRMPRQAGKNEISARAEGAILAYHASTGGQGVKAAPTLQPQALRSQQRLTRWLRGASHSRTWQRLIETRDNTVSLGQASWWFGSAEADAQVVGATASLLLEFDEAQDVATEKHDKDYVPMSATTGAARVYYGTPWTDFDVLAKALELALARQARDGRRRVFDVPWEEVAAELPAYGAHVESERERLGHTEKTPHPAFLTQYLLQTIPGLGRLFTADQLALLRGSHERQTAPLSASHATYVAGVDVGGSDLAQTGDPDETVLTIGRRRYPARGAKSDPTIAIVDQVVWRGARHDELVTEISHLLTRWRVGSCTVDATGLGEPLATSLQARHGDRVVTAFKFTRPSKSALGFALIAAVNTGALSLWQADGPDHAELIAQLRLARRETLPGSLIAWGVDASEGHDDRLVSLALCVHAASRSTPRVATMRST